MSRKSPARKGTTAKGKVGQFAQALTAKVERMVTANKRKRVKPPYVTPYLIKAVAQALAMPAISPAQAREHGAPVVIIDARKVVRTVKPTLWVRPDNTVRARLITLATLDPKVAKVAYLRFLPNNHPTLALPNASSHDDAYKVILYRTK